MSDTFFNRAFNIMKSLTLVAAVFAAGVLQLNPEGALFAICVNALVSIVVAMSVSLVVAYASSPLRKHDVSYARENFVCSGIAILVAMVATVTVEFNRLAGDSTTTNPLVALAVGMLGCAIFFASALRGDSEADLIAQ